MQDINNNYEDDGIIYSDYESEVTREIAILTITTLIIGYALSISIFAFNQNLKIKDLQEINSHNSAVIADIREELSSPEYKAVEKCKYEDRWKAECIAWELNNDSRTDKR